MAHGNKAPALHAALRNAMRIDGRLACGEEGGRSILRSLRLARIASHPRGPQTQSPENILAARSGAVVDGRLCVPRSRL